MMDEDASDAINAFMGPGGTVSVKPSAIPKRKV